jgi:manganese efflux pump family protein
MGLIALFAWLTTAGAGLYLLAVWLIEYDRDFQRAAATRLPIPVLSGHALLAVTGLLTWLGYLVFDNDRLAWAAVIILGAVAVLGLTMAVRWLAVYRATPAAARMRAGRGGGQAAAVPAAGPSVPPERNFPVSVVLVHGLFAVATLALVLLTALGVFES